MLRLKKYSKWLFTMSLLIVLAGCGKTASSNNEELPKATEDDYKLLIEESELDGFEYRFDPTLYEVTVKDVIVDENAIYGFSPNPDSERLGSYAEYDWSDPAVVESGRRDRIAYHESISTMYTMLSDMLSDGKDIETIARAISAERNRVRLASYEGDKEGLEKVKQSNLETYGDENGPSADSLFEKYGSWETVLTKAFSVNVGMDICLGLYDDYYYSYVELGVVPDVFGEMQNNNIPSELVKKYGSYREDTFILTSEGNRIDSVNYLDSEDMYVLDSSGIWYATVDGNLYEVENDDVYMNCLIGNAENPLLGDFQKSADLEVGITNLVGIKKYDADNILVTLAITDKDYITSIEEMCGYSQGDIKELRIKKIVSTDTYETRLSELYMITEDDSVKIGQNVIRVDANKPELDKSVLDKIGDKSRRRIEIIADNGTADEMVYTFDVGKNVHASIKVGDDYQPEVYEDAQYKKIYSGSSKMKKKVKLYIKKD